MELQYAMHPGRVSNATHVLGKPKDWKVEEPGHCSLAVREEKTTAGPGMTSAWFPTPEEIERIRNGAPIYLTVVGEVHPPVSMSVDVAGLDAGAR
jgi:hypothetical protein